MQKDKSLNEFLESLGKSSLGPGMDSIGLNLNNVELSTAGITLKNQKPGTVKPLFIKDFISSNTVIPSTEDERELFPANGDMTFLVKPENVTISQWISATMRIMHALLERGDIKSRQDVLNYMQYTEYTEQIREYFQIYLTSSVMLYDHRYRTSQAKEQFRWGTPDTHSVNVYLRPNPKKVGNITSLRI